eukprot:TRINITY_DN4511_c1_g3_i1.p1 TRINITY_DN4511_c1_g3~~TRINITY_DN4511_c1_g3_i1.p1  ORF type:complete len:122 (-),score=8.13 TRINITY_DN4511_c1_g3_i1:1645-2010(-)
MSRPVWSKSKQFQGERLRKRDLVAPSLEEVSGDIVWTSTPPFPGHSRPFSSDIFPLTVSPIFSATSTRFLLCFRCFPPRLYTGPRKTLAPFVPSDTVTPSPSHLKSFPGSFHASKMARSYF